MTKEQRQAVRLKARLTTTLKFLNADVEQRALTQNIGGGGICVVTEASEAVVSPGTPLEVDVTLPDHPTPIRFLAAVAWSRPVAPSSPSGSRLAIEVGLRIVSMDARDRQRMAQYAELHALPPGA